MPEDRPCLTRVELARKIKWCDPDTSVEVSVDGSRYQAAEVAIYRSEDGSYKVCIIGRV